MMRHWWNSHHTGEKRKQHNRSCNFSEKASWLRTQPMFYFGIQTVYIYRTGTWSSANRREALNSLYRVEKNQNTKNLNAYTVFIYLITAVQGSLVRAQYSVTASDILYRHKSEPQRDSWLSSRSKMKKRFWSWISSLTYLPAIISLVVQPPYEFYTFTDTLIWWLSALILKTLTLRSCIFKKSWVREEYHCQETNTTKTSSWTDHF